MLVNKGYCTAEQIIAVVPTCRPRSCVFCDGTWKINQELSALPNIVMSDARTGGDSRDT